MPDDQTTLADPPLTGAQTSARFRAGLIGLVVTEAVWLASCAALAAAHWSGLWFPLVAVLGLIIVVATAAGWIRLRTEGPITVMCLAFAVVILAALVSVGTQVQHQLAGSAPAGRGAVLGWAILTALLSLITMTTAGMILDDLASRQKKVEQHARTAERLAGRRWFGGDPQPPELLGPPLATPGVHGYELPDRTGFRYALVGGERVVLIGLSAPDDTEELAAATASWQDRLRVADDRVRVRGVLVDGGGLPAGQILALGVTPATENGLVETVGPWLGEPDHINVAIAALLMPAAA